MNQAIASTVVAATRKVHAWAVALHTQGLRVAVRGAEANAAAAAKRSELAYAVYCGAGVAYHDAFKAREKAQSASRLVRLTAEMEAGRIGGAL